MKKFASSLSVKVKQRNQIYHLTFSLTDFTKAVPRCSFSFSGSMQIIKQDIVLQTSQPFRIKVYPIPLHLKTNFEVEVDKLLSLGVIRPSKSPYFSPCVLVQKPDKTYRQTIDYKELNARTVFIVEPPCCLEEDLPKLANANFFTEIDLCKAYYQVQLTDAATSFTAFTTQHGLMEFTRMSLDSSGHLLHT